VRLSDGLWKKERWPEVLGFALRFSENEIHSASAEKNDQDLLFASFAHVWQLPFSPFLSQYHFNQNTFFAIAPFSYKEKTFELRLRPQWPQHETKDRYLEVEKALMKGEATALIQSCERGKTGWKNIARVTLRRPSHVDGDELAFNPFLDGMKLIPVGFIQHVRRGAYGLSQLGRKLSKRKIPGRENALPSSPPSHSP
jgi:hypothetical protein